MDVNKFIQEQLHEAKADYVEHLAYSGMKRYELINSRDTVATSYTLADITDLEKRLAMINGKYVKLYSYTYGQKHDEGVQKITVEKDGDYDYRICTDNFSLPLISGFDCVHSIIDAETAEVVFDNSIYCCQPVVIQAGNAFGKQVALEHFYNREVKNIQDREEGFGKDYKRKVAAINSIPDVIAESSHLIYTQLLNSWGETVCYRMSDLYNGEELNNAIQILEALNNGATVKKASELISPNHSGTSHAILCNVVLRYAKGNDGVAFFKQNSDNYKLAKPEERRALDKKLRKISHRNAMFEKELNEMNVKNIRIR